MLNFLFTGFSKLFSSYWTAFPTWEAFLNLYKHTYFMGEVKKEIDLFHKILN